MNIIDRLLPERSGNFQDRWVWAWDDSIFQKISRFPTLGHLGDHVSHPFERPGPLKKMARLMAESIDDPFGQFSPFFPAFLGNGSVDPRSELLQKLYVAQRTAPNAAQ